MTEGDVSYEVNTTNDDSEFLDYLLKSRDELIQMLESGISFDSMAILHYGQDSQNACLCQTPLPSPQDYESREHYRMACEKIDNWLFNGFITQDFVPYLRFYINCAENISGNSAARAEEIPTLPTKNLPSCKRAYMKNAGFGNCSESVLRILSTDRLS